MYDERIYRSAVILNRFGFDLHLTDKLTQNETIILLMISEYCDKNPDEPGIKTTCLSIESGTSKPLVSKLLNNLDDRGFIKRNHSKEDRRVIYITLSPDGAALRDGIISNVERNIANAQACIGKDKYDEFLELANALCGSYLMNDDLA